MRSSDRTTLIAVLSLFLFLAACDGPVVNVAEPEEVDSCEFLIPIGIELVNDYVYTLPEVDMGSTGGDIEQLPEEIVVLNVRGAELDARAVELDCDIAVLNREIADATSGIESADPIVMVFLDSVRGGIVAPTAPTHGEWTLETGTLSAGELIPMPNHPITLIIDGEAASGYAGCNGYYYPVALADGMWTWGEGTANTTDLQCVDAEGNDRADVLAVEVTFIRAFEQVSAYSLTDDVLVLTDGDGVELRFVRSAGN